MATILLLSAKNPDWVFQPSSTFFLLDQKEPKNQDKPDPSGRFVGPSRTVAQTLQTQTLQMAFKVYIWMGARFVIPIRREESSSNNKTIFA